MQLCGYGDAKNSTGVHDELYIKAMIFQNNQRKIGILSYDLLAVDSYLKTKILEQLPENYELILTATHTHQGPNHVVKTELTDLFLAVDETYHQYLVTQSVAAIKEASQSLENFTTLFGRNNAHEIYSNRHSLSNYYNQRINIIQFVTESKKVYGLINFSCHPTILKSDNTLFSKDLIWGIEKNLYGYDEVLFLNGTAGDISTRFHRGTSDYQQVNSTGKLLASTIMTTDLRETENLENLSVNYYDFNLKLKTPRPKTILEEEIRTIESQYQQTDDRGQKRNLETMIQGLQAEIDRSAFLTAHSSLSLSYVILDFGLFKIIGLPLEVFSVLAIDIFKYHKDCIVVSYVDGYLGYLVDDKSFDLGVYEAGSSLFARGEAEKLFKDIIARL